MNFAQHSVREDEVSRTIQPSSSSYWQYGRAAAIVPVFGYISGYCTNQNQLRIAAAATRIVKWVFVIVCSIVDRRTNKGRRASGAKERSELVQHPPPIA